VVTRVLVTDAESRKALACVRALGDEFEVWTVSASRISVAGWSRWSRRHFVVPHGPDYADQVLRLAGGRVGVIIAPQEDTILRLGRRADEFHDAGTHLSFPPLDVLERAFDKEQTLDLAVRAGVPAPPSAVLRDWDELELAAARLGYPVVVKPRRSVYWKGMELLTSPPPAYASDAIELRAAAARFRDANDLPILQRWVAGRGAGVFLLLARDGTLSAAFQHQRIRDVHPTGSASVVRRSVPLQPSLVDPALALLREMGLWGAAMVEFRVDEITGEPMLMEVNGRLWGSLQLAVDAGLNFPRMLVDVTQGGSPRQDGYRSGVVTRWWLGDLLRTARVMRGRPRGFPGPFPTRTDALREFILGRPRGMLNEVLRRDDPLPALGELAWAALRRR
jgi:predicted ATP-grasp superfamily ATP-dependent carboligase